MSVPGPLCSSDLDRRSGPARKWGKRSCAGSHEEAIEIRYQDFRRLEGDPKTGAFGRFPASAPRVWDEWPESRAR